jgi:Ras-related protein Rab-11A
MPAATERKDDFNYLFKIVLIGDTAVGKTNLLSKLTKNQFAEDSKATIGVEFGTMTFKMDNDTVKAQIWDTAGQERYQAIVQAYYRGTAGAVIVYDITNEKSLKKATTLWLKQLRDFSPREIPILLVGNKVDLADRRVVRTKEGEDAALLNNLAFFETSALTGENVREAFYELVKSIYQKTKAEKIPLRKKALLEAEGKAEKLKDTKPKRKTGCC